MKKKSFIPFLNYLYIIIIIIDSILNFYFFYIDEIYSNHENNMIAIKKDENVCSGNFLNTMYECVNGVCSGVQGKVLNFINITFIKYNN